MSTIIKKLKKKFFSIVATDRSKVIWGHPEQDAICSWRVSLVRDMGATPGGGGTGITSKASRAPLAVKIGAGMTH